ncbi:uncharacterized protein [Danio rerio]|uniref:lysozyme n=1 Tax=Danio rerio TaxID=7955 RepID=A0A8M1RTP2_DANRE|nr:uncharacterized protein LOC100536887 [Danio rerio]|eukprot:XP_003201752.1 uncharacterized protein LOC100536887 [Danio rerio]
MHSEVKMLAAVVVLFMAAGVSNSATVTKCSLKQELQAVLGAPLNATDILAKIVCHVALTTNFNTSAVNTIPEPKEIEDGHGHRHRRAAKGPERVAVTSNFRPSPNNSVPHPESTEQPESQEQDSQEIRHRRSPKGPKRVAVTSNFTTNPNNTVPHPKSSEEQDSHESRHRRSPKGPKKVAVMSNFTFDPNNTVPHPESSEEQDSNEIRHRRSPKGPERVAVTSNFITNPNNTVPHPESSEEQDSHEFRHRRAAKGPAKGRPAGKVTLPPPTTKPKNTEMWTMYGLFQLSDHVACNSTQSSKPNLCGLSCQKLIDDDITDDLACVKLLITKVTEHGPGRPFAEGMKEMKELLNPQCVNVVNSVYFSDC